MDTLPKVTVPEAEDGFINADELADGIQVKVTVPGGTAAGDKVTLTVTLPDNKTVTVEHVLTESEVNGSEATVTIPKDQVSSDGAYRVVAEISDPAGNRSGSSDAVEFTVDTTAEASVSLGTVTADNVLNAVEAAGDVTLTGQVTGDFQAGDAVTVTVNEKPYQTTLKSDGTFTVVVPGNELAADADRTVEVSVLVRDEAGNTATVTGSQPYTVAMTPPTQTVTITGISDDTGVSGDFITSDNDGLIIHARLSAALDDGERLMYSIDDGTTWTDITGSVSDTTVVYFDAKLTSTATVSMRVVDAAGNVGVTASQLVTIDTVAPGDTNGDGTVDTFCLLYTSDAADDIALV